MKKVICHFYILVFLLFFTSGFNYLNSQCIAGSIKPDSLWIPCGFSGSVTLNFYPQNGFCSGNHCSTSELAPFLTTGLIGWFPFCTANPMNDISTKANHFNTALPSDVFLNSVNNKNDINMLFPDRFGLPNSNSFGLSYFPPTTSGGQGTQFILQNNINPTPNSNKMTLSFWYLIDKGFSFNQNRGLFEMQDVSNNPIMQIWNSKDTSSCSGCHSDTLFIRHQTFNSTVILPYNSFKTNTPWVFVSIVIDASAGTQKASFYLNGQFIKDESINTATHVFGSKYQFGRITSTSGWTSQGSMSGNIDDIYFHERALNSYEVSILYKGYRTKWNNVNADSSNSINVTFPNNQSFYTIQLYKGANTTFLSDTVFVRNIRPQPFITPDPVFLCAQSNILFTLRDTINVPTKFAFQSNWGINLLQQPFLSREVYLNGVVKQAKTSVFNPNGNSTFLYVADSIPGVDTLWVKEWNIYNQPGCDTISKKVLITKYQLPPVPSIKDTSICQFRPTPPIDSFIKKSPLMAKYRLRYYADSTISDTLIKPILTTSVPGVFTFFASQVNDTTSCEGKRKRFTYTVLPTPLLTSDTILPSICSGTSVTSTFTNNLSNTSFAWNRSVNATLIPATRNGTGNISDLIVSSSTAPVVAIYTITLTNINGCSSTRVVRDTILPRPILSNTIKLKNICNGTLYSDTFRSATVGTTFSWTRNLNGTTGTGPASGTSAFLSDVLSNATVNPIVVSYPVTIAARGCISNDSLRVTVNPTPIMTTNPNPTQICSGQNYRDTIKSSTLGATFSWSRNTTGLNPISGSSATAFINETLTNSGTAKIVAKYVVSMTINSCTKVDTIFLTVNPIPTLSSTKTPTAICSQRPFNYSATSATRDSVLTWTKIANSNISSKGPNSGSNNIVNDTLINLTNTQQTQSYVYTVASNGCSKTDTVRVVVNPIPKLSSVKNILASCTGLVSYTPTSSISPIATTFSWSRPAVAGISNGSAAGSNSISESLINTTTSPLIVPYFYTLTANGCSFIDTIFATVNPTASINSPKFPTAICSGQSFNYKATSATSGVVFGWKRIDTSGITPTAIVPFTPSDTISEVLTNSNTFITRARYVISLTFGGCTRFDTVFVNVNPRPRFNPTPTLKNICNNAVYVDTMRSLTAGTSYSWTRILPSGVTGSGNVSDTNRIISQTLNNANTEPQTVIYPTVLTANGCTNLDTFRVRVNPTLILNSNKNLPQICSGDTVRTTLTSSTNNVSFSWTRPLVSGILPLTKTDTARILREMLLDSSVNPRIANYVVTMSLNGCSNVDTVKITIHPKPKLSSTKTPSPICSGTAFSYTPLSGTSSVSFAWNRPSVTNITTTAISPGTGVILDTLRNNTLSNINVTYIYALTANSCSNNDTVSVTVVPPPSSNLISVDTIRACGDSTQITSLAGMTTYTWSNGKTTQNIFVKSTGWYKLTATNTTGCTGNDSVFVSIVKANIINNDTAICLGNTVKISLDSSIGSSLCSSLPSNLQTGLVGYWPFCGNANDMSGNGNNGTVNGATLTKDRFGNTNSAYSFDGVNDFISISSNNLFDFTNFSISVWFLSINGSSLVNKSNWSNSDFETFNLGLAPSAINLSLKHGTCSTGVNWTNYNKQLQFNNLQGNWNHLISSVNGISVKFYLNGYLIDSSNLVNLLSICPGGQVKFGAWWQSFPDYFQGKLDDIGIWNRALSPQEIQQLYTPAYPQTYLWSTGDTTPTITVTPSTTTKYWVRVSNGSHLCTDTMTVTVKPLPKLSGTKTVTANCSGNVTYNAASTVSPTTYIWKRSKVTGITPDSSNGTSGSINENLINSTANPITTTYYFTLTANGCSQLDTVTASIIPTPSLSSTKTPTQICSGDTFKYKATTATLGATFSWIRVANANITPAPSALSNNDTIGERLTNTSSAPTIVKYVINLTANGCTKVDTLNLTVNPTPRLTPLPTLQNICNNGVLNITLNSATTGTTYNWTRNLNGVTGTGVSLGSTSTINDTLTNATTNPININYPILLTANGCQNRDTIKALVNPTPKLNNIPTTAGRCGGNAFNYTATSATTGASFAWSRAAITGITPPTNAQSSATISETLNNSTTSPIVVSYIYTTTINSCSGNDTIRDTIYPSPSLSSVKTATICSGTAFNYTATSATSGTIFSWIRPAVTGITTTATPGNGNNITDTLRNTTTAPIVVRYIFTLSANGCSRPDTVSVTVNPRPKLQAPKTTSSNCSGLVSYTGTSATTGTTFAWVRNAVTNITPPSQTGSNATINETLTNSTANPISVNYIYTLTANSCSEQDTVTASIIPTPSLSSTKTPTQICSGDTFKYKATTATIGATFSWIRVANANITQAPSALSNNDTIGERLTNTFTAPTIVKYVINLTANGCTKVDTVSLTVNPTPRLTPLPTLQNICNKGVLNITLNSATIGTNYNWNRNLNGVTGTGASSGSSITINDTLTNTTSNPININYPILLTANGCQNKDTIKALINPTPKLNNIPTTAGRCGGLPFSFTATSATTGATFAWSRASIAGITPATNAQSSATISETLNNSSTSPIVVSYIYTTTINSCSGNDTIRDTIYPSPSLNNAKTATICSGTEFNYTATSATAGTVFSWTRPAVTNITATATSGAGNIITDTLLNNSTAPIIVRYIFTLSANGCSRPDTVSVTVNPRPKLQAPKTTTSNCSGLVSYTGTSATTGTTFAWVRNAVTNITPPSQTGSNATINETLTNSTANPISVNYIYTLTANSCSEQDTVTASIIPTPSLSSTKNPTPICSGDTFKYKATTATLGATFSWIRMSNTNITPAPSALSNNDTIGERLTNTSTAPTIVKYVINLTANGCTKVDTVNLTVNPTPRLTPLPTLQNICNKGVLNITLNSSTTGTNYNWTRNLSGVTGTGASLGSTSTINDTLTNSTTNPININYPILLSANGCQNLDTIKALVNPTPRLNNIPTTAGRCGGLAFNFTATSATTGASFEWTRAALTGITPSINAQSSATISETLNNSTTSPIVVSYIYTTTINSCSGNDTIRDTIYPSPSLSSTKTATICSGTAFNYLATSATVGTIFSWIRPAVTGITTTATPGNGNNITDTLRNTTTAPIVVRYIFTLSANGCSRPDTVSVTVNPRPKLNSTKTITAACSGLVNYTPTSATTGSSFAWNRNAVTGIIPATNSGIGNISETISDTTPNVIVTRYFFTITANGCSELDTLSVSVNPSPILSSNKNPNAVCSGSLFSYTPTSATPSTTFSWSRATVSGISNAANTGTSGISETLINTTINPIVVTYVYTLTANSCSKTDTVRVRINPLPTSNISAPRNYICVGDSVLLTADTFPKYTYQWRLNSSNIVGATSRFFQVKAIGNYDVIVTDSNGCVRTSSVFNITSKPNPSTKIDTLGPVSVCIGGSIALRADTLAKARFQWFKNGTALSADTNRFISALSAGNYTYRVIDSNGCSSISSPTTVFFNNVPTAAASALGSTNFCFGGSATLTANNAPGSTYQWRKNSLNILGENLQTYEAITSGSYSVRVCNGGCCVVSNTILVNADTPPTATISPTTLQNLCAGSTATLTASSGVGYTYQWLVNGIPIAGATNSTYVVSDSGNYTCNITKGACTVAPPTVRVEIRPIPPVPFNIGNKTYCQGEVSSPVTASANLGNILKWYITATGGVGSTTAPTPSTLIADTIKYYVTQVSAFNCESPRVLLTVIVNPTPLKPIVANISYCQGAIAMPLTATLTTGDTLLWYNVASGGVGSTIAPTPSTVSVGTQLFYVSQKTKLGCEGPRDTIRVTIKPTPSFPIVNDIVYCQNYPAVPLSATLTTGDTLLWYSNGTGGVGSKIAPTPSTTTVGTFFFYVSQKTSLSCEGPRDTIKVTVNPTPLTPNAGNVTYCQGDSSVLLTATLTSDTLLWYTTATGGTPSYTAIKPSTAVAGVFKFYVSQKNTFGCESPRKEITVTINPTPKAPKVANIDYCQGQVVGKLTATADPGNILLWYTSSTGGVGDTVAPTPSTVDTGVTTFYVSQKTALGCESPRDSIKVQINFKGKIAPTTRDTTYCQWQKVDTLTAVAFFGNTLLWYSDSTTMTPFASSPKPNTAVVGVVDYYVSQITSKGCESPRALLKVTVNPTPLAPTTQSISYCQGIVSDTLIANVTPGNVLIWYADSVGGLGSTSSPAPSTMDTGILIFYVSQINKLGCESPRSPLNVRIFAPYKDTIQITNCVKITYKNKSYFSPSIVPDTIKSFRGCDSIYRTAILNVLLSDTVRLSICAYGQTYQYNGTFMGSSGIYQFKSRKINGCDSVVIIDLKLQEVEIIDIDTNVCDRFDYNGNTYNQSIRLPKDTIRSIYGCDSVHRFYNFNVSKPISVAGEIIEKCDSILFRNKWYFASTNIEDTIKKQAFPFCDSIYILNQLNVIYRAPIQIYANPDTVIIEGDTVELYATTAKTYKWSTGNTGDMIKVYPRVSTTYTITVSDDNNCFNSDEIFIRVKKDDSEVSLPNAFSPNGDFVNDVFKPDFYGRATLVQMMIFNRWGEKVYEGTGNYSAWDGTYFGEMQPSGVYSYYIVYTTTVSRFEKKGTVTLIR